MNLSSNFSKTPLGVCLEGWGTYLLSQDKPAEAAKLLDRALKVSKEVLGEDHEQVWTGQDEKFKKIQQPQRQRQEKRHQKNEVSLF